MLLGINGNIDDENFKWKKLLLLIAPYGTPWLASSGASKSDELASV
jgi:hypothetical protein